MTKEEFDLDYCKNKLVYSLTFEQWMSLAVIRNKEYPYGSEDKINFINSLIIRKRKKK